MMDGRLQMEPPDMQITHKIYQNQASTTMNMFGFKGHREV